MGSISIGSAVAYLGEAAAVAGAGASAYEAHEQGVATANANKQKALVEQQSETQKQIDMRQKLLAGLAAQNAGTLGAVGTGRATGFGANALRQINQAQNDIMVSSANSSAQVSLLDNAASQAESAGNIGAGIDLANGASAAAKNWPKSS